MNTIPPNPAACIARGGFFAALALILALSGLAGCRSPGGPGRPDKNTVAVQPALAAETSFFEDALTARVTLQPFALAMGAPGGGGGGGRRGGRPMGGPGGGMGGGGMGGGMGGPPPDGGMDGDEPATVRGPMSAPPRIVIHVAFTNHGKETIDFAPTDVVSDLGNFAVRPERLALAPGQTAEIDPMTSNFPMVIKELTVELRVRRSGKSETRSVRLLPAASAPATPVQP